MNKWLFCFVMCSLILTSLICLIIGVPDNKPEELWLVLLACVLLSCVFLTIVKSWDMLTFVFVLIASVGALWLLMMFTIINYILTYAAPVDLENPFIYTLRSASLIWPIAVLIIGTRKPKKKSRKAKPKEEK